MSQTTHSSVHPLSLVDPRTHSPELLHMVKSSVSSQAIAYAVDLIVDAVNYALGLPPADGKSSSMPCYGPFTSFVKKVISQAGTTIPTLLGALVYVQRAKYALRGPIERWALERVFLGSLIIASKYLNDSSLRNTDWSKCTGLFSRRDVGRMEREFLKVIDFKLRISERDILAHRDAVPYRPPPSPCPRFLGDLAPLGWSSCAQCCAHGSFTYTFESPTWFRIAEKNDQTCMYIELFDNFGAYQIES